MTKEWRQAERAIDPAATGIRWFRVDEELVEHNRALAFPTRPAKTEDDMPYWQYIDEDDKRLYVHSTAEGVTAGEGQEVPCYYNPALRQWEVLIASPRGQCSANTEPSITGTSTAYYGWDNFSAGELADYVEKQSSTGYLKILKTAWYSIDFWARHTVPFVRNDYCRTIIGATGRRGSLAAWGSAVSMSGYGTTYHPDMAVTSGSPTNDYSVAAGRGVYKLEADDEIALFSTIAVRLALPTVYVFAELRIGLIP